MAGELTRKTCIVAGKGVRAAGRRWNVLVVGLLYEEHTRGWATACGIGHLLGTASN